MSFSKSLLPGIRKFHLRARFKAAKTIEYPLHPVLWSVSSLERIAKSKNSVKAYEILQLTIVLDAYFTWSRLRLKSPNRLGRNEMYQEHSRLCLAIATSATYACGRWIAIYIGITITGLPITIGTCFIHCSPRKHYISENGSLEQCHQKNLTKLNF